MRINLNEIAKLLLICIIGIVLLICMWACNPLKKAENRVLANVESVQRVRAATDPLFPCANDSLVFIHDSTTVENTEYQRDTLIDVRNDSTFIYYYDTVTLEKTRYKVVNTIVTDNREINKLRDSLNSIRLREAEFKGKLLEKDKRIKDVSGAKTNWFLIALFAIIALLIIGFLEIYKALTNILPKLK